MEKLFITSDHAAYTEKEKLKAFLSQSYEVIDLGTDSEESTHYPIYGKKIAEEVLKNKGRGIALCGSGIGISIAVNRFKGIRGALCRTPYDAKMSRLHNNSNILCLGGRVNSIQELKEITEEWLKTSFEGGRHEVRTSMLDL